MKKNFGKGKMQKAKKIAPPKKEKKEYDWDTE